MHVRRILAWRGVETRRRTDRHRNRGRLCAVAWLAGLGWASLVVSPGLAQVDPSPLEQAADQPTDRLVQLAIYSDNDSIAYKPNNESDQHYTNGLGISLAWQGAWADTLANWLPFADLFGRSDNAIGLIVAQEMYTPEDITIPTLQRDDRPYAGYLYGGLFLQRANERTFDHFQLDLGLIGPSTLADSAQDLVHEVLGGDDPKGWDHQLHDEPTVQLTVTKKWRFGLGRLEMFGGGLDVQLIPHVSGALGTVHRYIDGGALLRIGGNLPDDFGPPRLKDLPAATGQPPRGFSWYAFLAAAARLVEHDTLLEGNNFEDSHGVDARPLVGRFEGGLGLAYHGQAWGVDLGYVQTHLTDQFDGQDHHSGYGTWTLRMNMLY